MAANINSFASLRVPAWHGLGTVIDKPVGAFEFQEIAGLNWSVTDSEIFTSGMVQIEGKKAIIRNDTGYPLGIVGSDYVSIQNEELFKFVNDLAQFDLELVVETAGALGNGETVWVLVKMPSLEKKIGDDRIIPYLTLINGHTGNYTFKVFPTPVRIVCQNTMRMALKGKNSFSIGWDIRHTSNAMDRMLAAKNSLKEIALEWSATNELIDRLVDVKLEDDMILDLISETFGETKKSKSGRGETLAENRNKKIFEILESGTSKVSGIEGSLWAGFNAITEWLDHDSILRSENKTEARFQNNLIGGPSLNYKEKAWMAALEMAGV